MITAVLFDLYETLVTEREMTPVRASSGETLGIDGAMFREIWKRQRSRVIRGERRLRMPWWRSRSNKAALSIMWLCVACAIGGFGRNQRSSSNSGPTP